MKIFNVNNCDIVLTYSPSIEISGHLYECFDYFLLLQKYFNVKILLFGQIQIDFLKLIWNSKYNVDFLIVEKNIIQYTNQLNDKLIIKFDKNTRILITDGNIERFEECNIMLMSQKIYGFKCFNDETKNIFNSSKIIYLQDNRIYNSKCKNSINYVKKIPFQFYKKSKTPKQNIGMMYIPFVCRKISKEIVIKYFNMSNCNKLYIIVPYKIAEYDNLKNIEMIQFPVYNFFDIFDTYIYTPVKRKFDCSSRLIAECIFQNKNIYKNIDYYDIALEVRYSDCINNFQSLYLTDNDDIIKILQQ